MDLEKQILNDIHRLVKSERKLLKQILLSLREIEKRKIYAKMGYSSLFIFCTRELKYSEAAAQRRIDAMRAIQSIPEIAEKIERGTLSLSTVSLAQRTIRQEQKIANINIKQKRSIFNKVENKTKAQAEKILAKDFPQMVPPDKTKQLTENQCQIQFIADQELSDKLEKIKNLYSHKNVSPTYNELFHMMADQILKTNKRTIKESKTVEAKKILKSEETILHKGREAPPLRSLNSEMEQKRKQKMARKERGARYIPSITKEKVFLRDKYECQYIDPKSKRRCKSRHLLQIDHIKPISKGGNSEVSNLQLLCSTHNQLKGDSH